jgi:UDP-GlcNAc:undecaprenyl-phosphate GlcNAc-1-phosphate transferase
MFFFVFLTALFVSMVLVAVFMHWAVRLDFLDQPDPRKVHRLPIPRVGGIGMVLGMVVAVLAWLPLDATLTAFLGGVAIIGVFGVWDDRADLDYKIKLGGQFLAVLVVVGYGGLLFQRLPWVETLALPAYVSYPLTVLFLLGTTNAINLSDGLDGLAAGLSLLSLTAIAFLADLADGDRLILTAVAIMGATLGFLRYNTHPALVFMGDTGSQFLGFSLGVLVLSLTQQVNTALTPGLALLVLGLPIIDTLTVMAQRLAQGHSPFKPDKNHFHHKLLSLGFDHFEAVLALYALQAVFVMAAYLLRYESYAVLTGFYFGLAAVIVLFYPLARLFRWRLRHIHPAGNSWLARNVKALFRVARPDAVALRVLGWVIPAFLIAGSFLAERPAHDLGYFVAAVVPVAVVFRGFRLPQSVWMERLMIYSCVILVIYAVEVCDVLAEPGRQAWLRGFFLGLAVLIAVGVRFSGAYFSVTPSDFLVLFILLAAAALPVFGRVNFAKLAVYSAVMLYGVEFVLLRRRAAGRLLWAGTLAAFTVVGFKTL